LSPSEASDPAWRELWFEPWRGSHASWLDGGAAPPDWPRLAGVSEAGRRLAYRLFCRHYGLPCAAARRPAPLHALPPHALDQGVLATLPLLLGMMCVAGTSAQLNDWLRATASPDVPAALWRDALRLARARPLAPPAVPAAAGSASLSILGLGRLHAASATLHSGLWPRLRLRCARSAVAAYEAQAAPEAADAATVRHIVRAWHVAAAHGARTEQFLTSEEATDGTG